MIKSIEGIKAASAGTAKAPEPEKAEPIKKQTLYLPESVWLVLRDIAHEERTSMHELVKGGINLMLNERGQDTWDLIIEKAKAERSKAAKK